MSLPPEEHDAEGVVRLLSSAVVREMLASLQEAVVATDAGRRRALLKGVIGTLQNLLSEHDGG